LGWGATGLAIGAGIAGATGVLIGPTAGLGEVVADAGARWTDEVLD